MADDGHRFFGDMVMPKGSQPTYIGGDAGEHGHVPIEEARRRALDDLAAAEAALVERQAVQTETQAAFVAAQQARDRAYEERQQARSKVKRAQERVAYVCSTEVPE